MAEDRVLDWDSEIEDGSSFELIPNGDYIFEVINVEKGQFHGSEKMRQSPMAIITMNIYTGTGTVQFKTNLILNAKVEFKISEFFRSIGMKKHGEKLRMSWNIVGKRGKLKMGKHTYTKKDGTSGESNDVEKFYDYNPADHGFSDSDEEVPF